MVFRIWWKSRGRTLTSRSGSGATRHRMRSPEHELAELAAVDGQRHVAALAHVEQQLFVFGQHQRPVEQHVRRDRGEHETTQIGRDDRAAGRERVGGGAGRGRHDQPVGRVRRERGAVDRHVEVHEVPRPELFDDRLVERVPAVARPRRPRSRRRRASCAPTPRTRPRSSRGSHSCELFGLELAEVAEHPDVDTEHRHRRRVDELHRVAASCRRRRGRSTRSRSLAKRVAVDRIGVEPGGRGELGGTRTSTPRSTSHAALRRASSSATGRSRCGTSPTRLIGARSRRGAHRGSWVRATTAAIGVAGHRRGPRRACTRNSTLPSAPAQRRRRDRVDTEARSVETGDDLVQHRGVHLGIAHDAPAADPGAAGLVLRLHEEHEVGGVGRRARRGSARPCATR